MSSYGGGSVPGMMGTAANELETLSTQLATQIDYNNALLNQMHRLEEQLMTSQRQLREQQPMIQQLQSERDSARVYVSEMREEMQRATMDSTDKKKDAHAYKAKCDSLAKKLGSAQNEVARLRDENMRLQTIASSADGQVVNLTEELRTLQSSANSQIADAKVLYESSQRRVHEVNRELEASQASLKAQEARMIECHQKIENTDTECRHLKNVIRKQEAKAEDDRRERERTEERWRVKVTKAEAAINELNGKLVQWEGQYTQSNKEAANLARKVDQMDLANVQLQRINDGLKNELYNTTEKWNTEREQLVAAVKQLQENAASTRDEAWRREQAITSDSKRSIEDLSSALEQARKSSEANRTAGVAATTQLQGVQKEYHALQETLQAANRERMEQQRQFNEQRMDLEKKIVALNSKVEEMDKHLLQQAGKSQSEITRLHIEIDALTDDLCDRTKTHTLSLQQYQDIIKELGTENQTLSLSYSRLAEATKQLRQLIHTEIANQNVSADGVLNEVKLALLTVVDHYEKEKKENTLLKDLVRNKDVTLEQEKMRIKSQSSRLEEQEIRITDLERVLEDNETDFTEKRNELVVQIEQYRREVTRLQAEYEISQTKRRAVEHELNEATRHLSETQARYAKRVNDLEEQGSQLRSKADETMQSWAKLTNERDTALAQLDIESHRFKTAEASLTDEIAGLMDRLKMQTEGDGTSMAQYQQEVMQLTSTLNKLQAQFGQTRSLLQTVQDHRRTLQTENARLKSEVDLLRSGGIN